MTCFLTRWLQKVTKRKKIHAFKSKMRMEQLEVTQNKRQNAWQQFQTTKGKAKKVPFSISLLFSHSFLFALRSFRACSFHARMYEFVLYVLKWLMEMYYRLHFHCQLIYLVKNFVLFYYLELNVFWKTKKN